MNIPETLGKMGKAVLKYKYLLIVALVGLIILTWPKGTDPPEAAPETQGDSVFSLDEMERKLAKTLSAIYGAGRVEVMLTLKKDMEVVVARDTDVRVHKETENGELRVFDEEAQSKTVITNSSGNAIVTQRIYPQFQGALIVCDGADNAQVQMAVLEAVTALTGLRSDAVTVAKKAGT